MIYTEVYLNSQPVDDQLVITTTTHQWLMSNL